MKTTYKIIISIVLISLSIVLIILGKQYEIKQEQEIEEVSSNYVEAMAIVEEEETFDEPKYYIEDDIVLLAKTAYCEGRGINSKMELACIMWIILNRVDCDWQNDFADKNTIREVVLQPNQFAYSEDAPFVTDWGYDLYDLARDVLDRWSREKNGDPNPGRVLPKEYLWYASKGDGHNYFRTVYRGSNITYWDYSLENPYET